MRKELKKKTQHKLGLKDELKINKKFIKELRYI
jgi:hypothetical protein